MKYMLKGELQAECGLYGAVAATRCDEIVLNCKDVRDIAAALNDGAESRRAQLAERFTDLLTHFPPGTK